MHILKEVQLYIADIFINKTSKFNFPTGLTTSLTSWAIWFISGVMPDLRFKGNGQDFLKSLLVANTILGFLKHVALKYIWHQHILIFLYLFLISCFGNSWNCLPTDRIIRYMLYLKYCCVYIWYLVHIQNQNCVF